MDQQESTLFRLPAELRTNIYEQILDGVFCQTQRYPYDPVPSHSRFKTYVHLLQTCQKLHREIEPIFQQRYAQQTVFYFEEVLPLYDFSRKMGNFPNPDEAIFNLSYNNKLGAFDYDSCGFTEGWNQSVEVERFMTMQPCFKPQWQNAFYPGLFNHLTYCQRHDTEDWPLTNSQLNNFDPNQAGHDYFKTETLHKDSCTRDDAYVPFNKLTYPEYNAKGENHNTLRLTVYTWTPQPSKFYAAGRRRYGSMVLQGKLGEAKFTDFETRVQDLRRSKQ